MTKDVAMTPRGEVVWQSEQDTDGTLYTDPAFDFSGLPYTMEELVMSFDSASSERDLPGAELIGEGAYGVVHRLGDYAVKYVTGSPLRCIWFQPQNTERILDQSRIAVTLREGLARQRLLAGLVAAPRHFASWQATQPARDGNSANQIQVMEYVPPDTHSSEPYTGIKRIGVQKIVEHALAGMGMSKYQVHWRDLPGNIIVSRHVPTVIDLMPTGPDGLVFEQ
jgi:hypothetical protein